jgi:hypothetical protein
MSGSRDTVLERVKVREGAEVFRSRDALDAAVDDLMLAGIDRADIDLMADCKTIALISLFQLRAAPRFNVPSWHILELPSVASGGRLRF